MALSYIITAVYLLFESLPSQGGVHPQFLQMSTENSHIWQGKLWITHVGGTGHQHCGELPTFMHFFRLECVFCTVNSVATNAKQSRTV